MVLWPAVKEFIETYIDEIEENKFEYVLKESIIWLNDVEFNNFYDILSDLFPDVDLDDIAKSIINDICDDIIESNIGNYICIEDEWDKIAGNHLANKDDILYAFDDFECDIKNGQHWCEIDEY